MDLHAGIFALELNQSVIRLHRFLEGVLGVAETIMKFRHSIQGQFYREQTKAGFLQRLAQLSDRSIGKVTVRGNVDFFNSVLPDKLAADRTEFLSQKGLATGEIQILDMS